MPHALVLRVKFAAGWDPEQVKMLDEMVVPLSKSQPGFQRGIWMHDDVDGMGVIVFTTAAEAEAARVALNPPPGGPTLESSSVFEVAAEA